jgi:histidinol-phosphatase (PHP family)
MIPFNFHQHSLFSDGKAEPEAYVKKAVELGFIALGFTEHSPLPFETSFSLKRDKIQDYIEVTETLKEKYGDRLALYRALEIDFIPQLSEDFETLKQECQTDYAIGGVHLVKPDRSADTEIWFIDVPDREIYDQGIRDFFDGDVKKAVRTYFRQLNRMIETQSFDVVAHFDKIKMHNQNRFFTDQDSWYQTLIDETLDLIKQKQLIVEVNTRGLYKKRSDALFPDHLTLKKAIDWDIPLIVSSDAHRPEELDHYFGYAEKRIQELGGKRVLFFNGKAWVDRALS